MRIPLIFLSSFFIFQTAFGQTVPRSLPAHRTTATIKIDGNIDEQAWKEAVPARDFFEWRPTPGRVEDSTNRTIVYILYDNTSVYVGGYCYERTKDSISKELVGRDVVGVNDFVGVILDTYNDKINASGFYVTPYGEQFDAKYSNGPNEEDESWNAVWDSEAKIHSDGWSFEMRIPYSALRFSNKSEQSWGLNITRRRNKTGQQYMWNPIDPKVNGFINQEGLWTGIGQIQSPLRLSFSPYLSAYLNHYPSNTPGKSDYKSSVNGGMDVKYGITEGFTLDMTLIPDFGQVQSDNQVLNLSPFEVKYNENRSFFTEGTELFNKGSLFYSRRIGSTPVHFGDVDGQLKPGETILSNPQEAKLINATKVSGRTRKGLGIGFLNAITQPMYAEVQDVDGTKRRIRTNPLTNYNILVFDQTLKNNSAITLVNTNVTRSGSDYDANVTAGLFDFNNKKNTYRLTGKVALSQLNRPDNSGRAGYSHDLSFGKTGGRWNYQIGQEVADTRYDINDLGILFNNNYIDHFLWTGYRWIKPGKWYNRIQVNYNAYYSRLFTPIEGQKMDTRFQSFRTNVNANAQLKNLWFVGAFIGYIPYGHDFYEAHQQGYIFRSTKRTQFSGWFETNSAKKFYFSFNYFLGLRKQFSSPNHELDIQERYRFSDKFSVTHNLSFYPVNDDAGFYGKYYMKDGAGNEILDAKGNRILQDVIFSRRNRTTVENILRLKYNFNYRSGLTVRVRHYWSQVDPKQLYDLQTDGNLVPTKHQDVQIYQQNYNFFNVDAVYTWQFAPGSFLNIVWKDESFLAADKVRRSYFHNIDDVVASPQNNNLSVKLIYYLDYLQLKNLKKKK